MASHQWHGYSAVQSSILSNAGIVFPGRPVAFCGVFAKTQNRGWLYISLSHSSWISCYFYAVLIQFLPFSAVYKPHCDHQKKEIERIRKEENMSLPQDIDYFSVPVSLSQEVREILDRVRPSTVSS